MTETPAEAPAAHSPAHSPAGAPVAAAVAQPAARAIPGEAPDGPKPEHFSSSPGFLARLHALNVSLAFTSYQSNALYMIGRRPDGGMHLHLAHMMKPMGLSWEGDGRLAVAAGFQIVRYENVLAPHERANGAFDACFAPRTIHVTGRLDAHDVGLGADGRPVFANTRFNCLAAVSPRHSFEVVWRPPFVSATVDEDRCHLNGLAMRDGAPAYASAVSRSDTVDGWRDRRADGGVVVDVATNEIVCTGLSMPHSPRLYRDTLWVLNSGAGEFGRVDLDTGRFEPAAFCPGFLRGLAFAGRYAFVGLSKPRYKRFEGLALDDRLRTADSEPWCGVQILDLEAGTCVDWFRIDGPVAELYDVEVIPGFACPMAVAPHAPEAASLVTWEKPAPDPAKDAQAA